MQTKIDRIQSLVKELNTYRNEYYNLNKPSVSDTEYDTKFDELSKLEKEINYILSDSPTCTVGYEIKSKLNKRVHPTPLKSLDKTKSIDELNKWRNNKDIILMLKADGLTVELDYENGSFVGGYTRGNGEIGEDISHNCRVFKNIPLSIPFQGKLRVSGEAIIHWNDFNNINSMLSDDEKYATPRNLVAGSVRQLDNKICSQRNVYFYAFNILECSEVLLDSKHYNFAWLWEQGFWTIFSLKLFGSVSQRDIECMVDYAKDIGIPIDGLVGSFDSVKYSNSLTITSHHPLHSMAYKFKDEAEVTTLESVEWNVGRTGVITPVAKFKKVILDNTEVTRASLHNLSICEELELGIGDSISIIKCNMIIPQIEENFTRSNNLFIPEQCPVCGGVTIIEQLNESKVLYCTNEDCSAKLLKKFSHFVSRNAMNIDGLSEATLEKFLDEGFIEKFSDIYNIEQFKSKIVKMDGFGLKSYNNMAEAIETSKKVKFENFVFSLGIDQIGLGGAKRLAKHFNNDINAFLEATKSPYNFKGIEDFGNITSISVYEYFKNEDNMNQVLELLKYVTIKQEEKKEIVNSNSIFTGKKIYGTGSFSNYKKEELKALLESLGAEFASGYAKSLDYLIVGSLKGSSKEDKAKKDGVPVLSEDEFIKMIGR